MAESELAPNWIDVEVEKERKRLEAMTHVELFNELQYGYKRPLPEETTPAALIELMCEINRETLKAQ